MLEQLRVLEWHSRSATTADLAGSRAISCVMEQAAAAAGDIDADRASRRRVSRGGAPHRAAVPHDHIWRSIAPRIRAYFYRHFRERDLDSVVAEHRELLDALHQRRPSRSCSRRSTGTSSCRACRGRPSQDEPTAPQTRRRETRMSKRAEEYRYEKLTWPEINDAVELGKVCIVPVRRRRAARAAPAARRRHRLPDGDRARRRRAGPRQDARAADGLLRLHRAT